MYTLSRGLRCPNDGTGRQQPHCRFSLCHSRPVKGAAGGWHDAVVGFSVCSRRRRLADRHFREEGGLDKDMGRVVQGCIGGERHLPFQVLDATAIEGIRGLVGESSSIYSCQIYKALTPPAPPSVSRRDGRTWASLRRGILRGAPLPRSRAVRSPVRARRCGCGGLEERRGGGGLAGKKQQPDGMSHRGGWPDPPPPMGPGRPAPENFKLQSSCAKGAEGNFASNSGRGGGGGLRGGEGV